MAVFPSGHVLPPTGWPGHVAGETSKRDGIRVDAINVQYSNRQSLPAQCGSDVEMRQTGRNAGFNINPLRPMEDLQSDHSYNPNLVHQFVQLSASFVAWRPVRGDGNCYYRAVMFAWIEKCVAACQLERLRGLIRQLEDLMRLSKDRTDQSCVDRSHRYLEIWVRKRLECASPGTVQSLMLEIVDAFNEDDTDYAFIWCLRRLVANYLRTHATERLALTGTAADSGGGLTYESWAKAICGAKSIDDYCEQHIEQMNRDAEDHVQHACPRVLGTVVRICVVDRLTASFKFIDCGSDLRSPSPSPSPSPLPTATSTSIHAQVAQREGAGKTRPEIYLLLKPGHYDILVPSDAEGACGPEIGLNAKSEEQIEPHVSHQRGAENVKWRDLVSATADLCARYQAVVACLESKLAEELAEKRRRQGNVDESLFEGRLTNLLDPLHAALSRVQAEAPAAVGNVATNGETSVPTVALPALRQFFSGTGGFSRPIPIEVTVSAAPKRPVVSASRVHSSGLDPVPVQMQQGARQHYQGAFPPKPRQPTMQNTLCCICMQTGATACASCGCCYHPHCLAEYVDTRPRDDISCHLHDRPLGSEFVRQHISSPVGPALDENVSRPVVKVVGGNIDSTTVRSTNPPPRSVISMTPMTNLQIEPADQEDGIPCVICFGEQGAMKRLHCGYKIHVACLTKFWYDKVMTIFRFVNIPCPAEIAGCARELENEDLHGVITQADFQSAERIVREVDERNQQLINDLKQEQDQVKSDQGIRPMFTCAICLLKHEVEGCCTLPCQHRFCFESLQHHFGIIVRERRLNKLMCPAEGCGFDLRSEEYIHIFRRCLPDQTYHKLHEFLARDNPNICECRHPGCEERMFLDEGDDATDLACSRGHRFCGNCPLGPHPGMTCERRRDLERAEQERKERRESEQAWSSALALGWKPCPKRCSFGGGCKADEECDHVTCECGHEFCWDCGVDRRIPLCHDNRWHKPSCRYHTRTCDVSDPPVWAAACNECRRMQPGVPCMFPKDDGYPGTYM